MVQDLDSQAQQFKPLLDKMDLNSWCPLTQALFDQSVLLIKSRKTTREFYQLNDQLTEEQVIENVANNYYQVYVLSKLLAENNLTTTTKVRDIVKVNR
jgi:hypothetical protein